VSITATDIHPQTLEVARRLSSGFPEIKVESADALALPYADRQFDVSILCLTLHHFDDAGQRTLLRELARVSRRAVIISELERHRLNYLGARLLAATWWRRNRITRHDGPLSVLRAFTSEELAAVAQNAGFDSFRVDRDFFFRLLLVIET
jgi:ubiquinone/menaquinone biosynthesis C-methylase UbiE